MIRYRSFGGRGVAANMRPCQGRDRGFESRRSRSDKTLDFSGVFLFESSPHRGDDIAPAPTKLSIFREFFYSNPVPTGGMISRPLRQNSRFFGSFFIRIQSPQGDDIAPALTLAPI